MLSHESLWYAIYVLQNVRLEFKKTNLMLQFFLFSRYSITCNKHIIFINAPIYVLSLTATGQFTLILLPHFVFPAKLYFLSHENWILHREIYWPSSYKKLCDYHVSSNQIPLLLVACHLSNLLWGTFYCLELCYTYQPS